MFMIYDLISLVIMLIYLPIYLFRRKFHRGFLSRLGFLPKGAALNNPIWIHAVSVGEAMAIKALVEELRLLYPAKRLVISTVTPTGNKIAHSIAKAGDFVTYLPLDFSFIIKRVINKIKPAFFILAETELWPNLISYLYKKNIPVAVVNGRISDKSFQGYQAIKFLLKPLLNKIALFCVQTERDEERLVKLGVAAGKVRVTGNMKFDTSASLSINPETNPGYQAGDSRRVDFKIEESDTDSRLRLGLASGEKILLAASTHPGEEEIVLDVYKKLLADFRDLRLLIAPRHPARAKEIEKLILRNGFQSILISNLSPIAYRLSPITYDLRPTTVFILDTIGELVSFYGIAEIVFVGGSLIKKGGHNILEPAVLGKPVIFGPYMFNFREIADLFLENQAAILANNRKQLLIEVKKILLSPQKSKELGERARELTLSNQGATQRTAKCIKEIYA